MKQVKHFWKHEKPFRKNISIEIVNQPSYYAFGKHFINIIHTKLRHKCILHYDLYKRNITNTPFCSCGQNVDLYHFFLCMQKLFLSQEQFV